MLQDSCVFTQLKQLSVEFIIELMLGKYNTGLVVSTPNNMRFITSHKLTCIFMNILELSQSLPYYEQLKTLYSPYPCFEDLSRSKSKKRSKTKNHTQIEIDFYISSNEVTKADALKRFASKYETVCISYLISTMPIK